MKRGSKSKDDKNQKKIEFPSKKENKYNENKLELNHDSNRGMSINKGSKKRGSKNLNKSEENQNENEKVNNINNSTQNKGFKITKEKLKKNNESSYSEDPNRILNDKRNKKNDIIENNFIDKLRFKSVVNKRNKHLDIIHFDEKMNKNTSSSNKSKSKSKSKSLNNKNEFISNVDNKSKSNSRNLHERVMTRSKSKSVNNISENIVKVDNNKTNNDKRKVNNKKKLSVETNSNLNEENKVPESENLINSVVDNSHNNVNVNEDFIEKKEEENKDQEQTKKKINRKEKPENQNNVFKSNKVSAKNNDSDTMINNSSDIVPKQKNGKRKYTRRQKSNEKKDLPLAKNYESDTANEHYNTNTENKHNNFQKNKNIKNYNTNIDEDIDMNQNKNEEIRVETIDDKLIIKNVKNKKNDNKSEISNNIINNESSDFKEIKKRKYNRKSNKNGENNEKAENIEGVNSNPIFNIQKDELIERDKNEQQNNFDSNEFTESIKNTKEINGEILICKDKNIIATNNKRKNNENDKFEIKIEENLHSNLNIGKNEAKKRRISKDKSEIKELNHARNNIIENSAKSVKNIEDLEQPSERVLNDENIFETFPEVDSITSNYLNKELFHKYSKGFKFDKENYKKNINNFFNFMENTDNNENTNYHNYLKLEKNSPLGVKIKKYYQLVRDKEDYQSEYYFLDDLFEVYYKNVESYISILVGSQKKTFKIANTNLGEYAIYFRVLVYGNEKSKLLPTLEEFYDEKLISEFIKSRNLYKSYLDKKEKDDELIAMSKNKALNDSALNNSLNQNSRTKREKNVKEKSQSKNNRNESNKTEKITKSKRVSNSISINPNRIKLKKERINNAFDKCKNFIEEGVDNLKKKKLRIGKSNLKERNEKMKRRNRYLKMLLLKNILSDLEYKEFLDLLLHFHDEGILEQSVKLVDKNKIRLRIKSLKPELISNILLYLKQRSNEKYNKYKEKKSIAKSLNDNQNLSTYTNVKNKNIYEEFKKNNGNTSKRNYESNVNIDLTCNNESEISNNNHLFSANDESEISKIEINKKYDKITIYKNSLIEENVQKNHNKNDITNSIFSSIHKSNNNNYNDFRNTPNKSNKKKENFDKISAFNENENSSKLGRMNFNEFNKSTLIKNRRTEYDKIKENKNFDGNEVKNSITPINSSFVLDELSQYNLVKTNNTANKHLNDPILGRKKLNPNLDFDSDNRELQNTFNAVKFNTIQQNKEIINTDLITDNTSHYKLNFENSEIKNSELGLNSDYQIDDNGQKAHIKSYKLKINQSKKQNQNHNISFDNSNKTDKSLNINLINNDNDESDKSEKSKNCKRDENDDNDILKDVENASIEFLSNRIVNRNKDNFSSKTYTN